MYSLMPTVFWTGLTAAGCILFILATMLVIAAYDCGFEYANYLIALPVLFLSLAFVSYIGIFRSPGEIKIVKASQDQIQETVHNYMKSLTLEQKYKLLSDQ